MRQLSWGALLHAAALPNPVLSGASQRGPLASGAFASWMTGVVHSIQMALAFESGVFEVVKPWHPHGSKAPLTPKDFFKQHLQ